MSNIQSAPSDASSSTNELAPFLGLSGLGQGQGVFEEFGQTFCGNPNAAAVAATLDSAATDPRMVAVIALLHAKLVALPEELCLILDDRIPPEGLTSIFTIGVSQANVESIN